MFQFKFSFLAKATVTAITKNINVAFVVVKKLPVLLIGNISIKNKNIKGVIIWLYFNFDSVKYFLKKEIYKIIRKIEVIIKKPKIPVSVNISK